MRVSFFAVGLSLAAFCAGAGTEAKTAGDKAATARIPVILSTDIGGDIDDTWALALALKCPELDVKLVLGDSGTILPRARLIAKFLEAVKRTDIAVGIGFDDGRNENLPQSTWFEGYELDRYPGKVHRDGVQAMIDLVMASKEPVTLLFIGPTPNMEEALRREPRIAQKARFVGMYGSVRVGYGPTSKPCPETNVRVNPAACRAALSAPWVETVITPLDTCARILLRGADYARVRDAQNPVAQALMQNYRAWSDYNAAKGWKPADPAVSSTTLYDCAAVYLAVSQSFCVMEKLGIRVDDDGFTREDPSARQMNVATAWKDLPGFKRWLVGRLCD